MYYNIISAHWTVLCLSMNTPRLYKFPNLISNVTSDMSQSVETDKTATHHLSNLQVLPFVCTFAHLTFPEHLAEARRSQKLRSNAYLILLICWEEANINPEMNKGIHSHLFYSYIFLFLCRISKAWWHDMTWQKILHVFCFFLLEG